MSEDTKKIHLLKVNATAFDNILTKANNAINSKSVVETSHGGTGLVEVDANALTVFGNIKDEKHEKNTRIVKNTLLTFFIFSPHIPLVYLLYQI